jgi:hypothetical protein
MIGTFMAASILFHNPEDMERFPLLLRNPCYGALPYLGTKVRASFGERARATNLIYSRDGSVIGDFHPETGS